MVAMSLNEIRERLENVVDRLARGETIEIERSGKPRLRLAAEVADERGYEPIDIEAMRAFAKSMPYQKESAVELVRRMRDEGY